jgi:DUF4097 and DUF4098 domain-containing protein YvlB
MKTTGKWAIFGTVLLVSGLITCWLSYALFGFDLESLNTTEYVYNTYEVKGTFKDIKIEADTEKISFVLSTDGKCKVECFENKEAPHEVTNSSNTLSISETHNKLSWNINLTNERPYITVYLPEKDYEKLKIDSDTGDILIPADFRFIDIEIQTDTGDVSNQASSSGKMEIKTDTGDISLNNVSADKMELKSHNGKIELNKIKVTDDLEISENTGKVFMDNVACRDFHAKSDTGRFQLKGVVAQKQFEIKTDTGNIEFEGCDARDISIRSDTGKVSGSLLSPKIFTVKSSTGKIDVPESAGEGKCEIKTDTGNITITIS